MIRAVLIGCVVISLASSARSQTVSGTSGAITGTVTDSTRAVLAGVTVTLSGPAVMGSPVAVTDQNGLYRLFDVRTEQALPIKTGRVVGFFDVYNIFNTNAEQALSVSSGGAWLRPTAITPPRIARIGLKLVW